VHRRTPDRPAERLADSDAERLLARASELDAASAGATVTELREAAAQAGISHRAFDAALAELQGESASRALASEASPRGRGRVLTLVLAATLLIAAGAFAVKRTVVPTGAGAGANVTAVEEAFLLRCLSGNEAAELVRPLLSREHTTALVRATAPRVLTIRATPEQLREVRALLEQHEGTGSTACTSVPRSQ
jgi:hypothetical protein